MHAFVLPLLGDPLGGGDLVLGQAGVRACRTDALDQLGALTSQLAEQEAPASPGDVDVLASDSVQDRWTRFADVERGTDLFARLLGDATDFDDHGTVVDLEAVDVIGRRTTTDLVETLDDQGSVTTVSETGRGEQSSRSSSDDDDLKLMVIGHVFPVDFDPSRQYERGSPSEVWATKFSTISRLTGAARMRRVMNHSSDSPYSCARPLPPCV
jgi:hypothetical protein